MLQAVVDLGGFAGIAALAGVIVSLLGNFKQLRKIEEKTRQLEPDHGTSLADRLERVEMKVDLLADVIKSQGHQIGEIRADAHQIHSILDKRLERLEAVDDRLGFLK